MSSGIRLFFIQFVMRHDLLGYTDFGTGVALSIHVKVDSMHMNFVRAAAREQMQLFRSDLFK